MSKPSFVATLKHRNVPRAALLYIGATWALAQGLAQLAPALGLPDWITRWLLIAAVIGFPFWIAFAWYYQLTPEGLKREHEVAPGESIAPRTGRHMDFWIIGVIAIAVLLLANTLVRHNGPVSVSAPAKTVAVAGESANPTPTTPNIPAKSIAVLPFENLSNSEENEYFVAGMQDLILTKLADIGELKVISRTSTMKYKSRPDNLKQVALELGVATVLEGSVQRHDNKVLINVQLIDAGTDAHLWANTYQRDLKDVFGVEGEVAGRIAAALKAKLTPTESRQLATDLSANSAANLLFMRAEYLANRASINYDTAGWKQARDLYKKVLDMEPGFALAWARLSYVSGELAWFGGGGDNVQQLRTEARVSAGKALTLAPDLPAAHLAKGYSEYWGAADYDRALQSFAAALKARPNDGEVLAAQSYVERRQGRFEASIISLHKALELDPRNTVLAFELGTNYAMVSRYKEAEQYYQQALALDPTNVLAISRSAPALLFANGNVQRALDRAKGDDPRLQLLRVKLLQYGRRYEAAIVEVEKVPDSPDNFPFKGGPKPLILANLYRLAGDHDRALPLFQQALPQIQAQLASLAGSAINQSYAWSNMASVQLGLGHKTEAKAAIAKSQDLMTGSGDHVYSPWVMELNAALYAQAGNESEAVPLLEQALRTPGIGQVYSPVMLRIDPAWDPIRKSPRFKALLNKYPVRKSAVVSSSPATPASASVATRS